MFALMEDKADEAQLAMLSKAFAGGGLSIATGEGGLRAGVDEGGVVAATSDGVVILKLRREHLDQGRKALTRVSDAIPF